MVSCDDYVAHMGTSKGFLVQIWMIVWSRNRIAATYVFPIDFPFKNYYLLERLRF